jgi:hypothetical protein
MKEKTARSCDKNNKHGFMMAACTKLLFPSDKTVVEVKETDVNKQSRDATNNQTLAVRGGFHSRIEEYANLSSDGKNQVMGKHKEIGWNVNDQQTRKYLCRCLLYRHLCCGCRS